VCHSRSMRQTGAPSGDPEQAPDLVSAKPHFKNLHRIGRLPLNLSAARATKGHTSRRDALLRPGLSPPIPPPHEGPSCLSPCLCVKYFTQPEPRRPYSVHLGQLDEGEMLYRPPAPEPRTKFRELAIVFALVAVGIVITLWGGWEIGAFVP
jgi:hypothetical protein